MTRKRRTSDLRRALEDARWMRKALAEARRGRGATWPNPMVGAVVVNRGRLVGRGYHRRVGEPHAEVHALRRAGQRARGATVYVNLEPCAHHGRTPPCVERLIESGVGRVVFSIYDPNPLVSGRGAARLREAGIEVTVGVRGEEARCLNEVFIRHVTADLPFVALKSASTLDGSIATRTGDSQWITGLEARRRVHALRRDHGAVLVGVGTVIADDPSLTVRHVPGPSPLRIVLDSRLRTPLTAKLAGPLARGTIFACVERASDGERARALRERGAEIWGLPADADGRVALLPLLERARERKIPSILVEGGAEIFTAFVRSGLADKHYAFVAPRLLGGGRPLLSDLGRERMEDSIPLHGVRVRSFGADAAVEGYFDSYFGADPTDEGARPRARPRSD